MSEVDRLLKQFKEGLHKERTCTVSSRPVKRYCVMGRITFVAFIECIRLRYESLMVKKPGETIEIPWATFEFQTVIIIPSNSLEEGMFFGSESIE